MVRISVLMSHPTIVVTVYIRSEFDHFSIKDPSLNVDINFIWNYS